MQIVKADFLGKRKQNQYKMSSAEIIALIRSRVQRVFVFLCKSCWNLLPFYKDKEDRLANIVYDTDMLKI